MKLDSSHHAAIEGLLAGRFGRKTLAEIAAEVGISARTLRRWQAHPDFMAAYEARVEEWQRDFSDIRLAERKERIRELARMYQETPDSYRLRIVRSPEPLCNPAGEELRDDRGQPVFSFTVYRSNVALKRALLAEIAEQLDTPKQRDEGGEEPSPVAWAREAFVALNAMEATDGANGGGTASGMEG